ncbi:DUF6355 family natural product biosynthesis protein [Lentzea sp. NPDC054927]
MVLVSVALGLIDSPSSAAEPNELPPCGFSELNPPRGQQTARYYHCGGGFILIKYHWSRGSTGTTCLPPWDVHPFFWDGEYRVVNAYYVTTRPNLTGPPDDLRCSLVQPRV